MHDIKFAMPMTSSFWPRDAQSSLCTTQSYRSSVISNKMYPTNYLKNTNGQENHTILEYSQDPRP